MTIGWTLGLYFAQRFLRTILIVFSTIFTLGYTLDFVELMRRTSEMQGSSAWLLAGLSLLRIPVVTEQIIPFAVLFGSLATFLDLNRKLELVVTRAAGVSAWQFIFPGLVVAGLLGVFAVTVYNPVASTMKRKADVIEGRLFGREGVGSSENRAWMRQKSVDGEAIIRAEKVLDKDSFSGLTVFAFYPDGRFMERIEAPTAELKPGFWDFRKARVLTTDSQPAYYESYQLATHLTPDQIRASVAPTDTVSFWELPALVSRLKLAGLETTRYRLKYQSLLAKPLLLIAMVFVAASVSLRFFRFGGVARMVLGGVTAGFMLYVATEVAEDLGSAGVISAVVASWTPACIGSLLGVLALLYQEDG
jgi:lipopolysaccharide export system permease protein